MEWDEARPTLEEDKRFAAVASEEERQRLFGEYIEDLKERVREMGPPSLLFDTLR